MNQATEAFSRVKIDDLLKDAGWNLTDGVSVLFEHALADGSRADYALCDRSGRPVAAVEAKRASINPVEAQDQGGHYAELLGVPFVFLCTGLNRTTRAVCGRTYSGLRFATVGSLASRSRQSARTSAEIP